MTFEPIRPPRRRRSPVALVAGGAGAFAVAVALAVGVGSAPSDEVEPSVATAAAEADGTAQAAGVVVDGADRHLGRVPLDVTVEPTWTLRNASDVAVTFGQPHAEVLEGCCPGPLDLGATTLAPGEQTTLTFPLQMHEGMDGPHDFAVHVPVVGATSELLVLGVDGDFRD